MSMLTIVALSVAILYLAWRSGKIQAEMHDLKTAVEATVSLHEIEDQLLPTIDALEQGVAGLKKEMSMLRKEDREHRTDSKHGNADVFSEAFPDISLLMGMQQLIGGACGTPTGAVSSNGAGVATTRVFLNATESTPVLGEIASEDESEEDASSGTCILNRAALGEIGLPQEL